jgi:hypothetical protein
MKKSEAEKPISYRYLNMNTREFVASNADFAKAFRGKKHMLRVIPSTEYAQILVAAGISEFSEREAINMCNKLLN